MGNLRLCPVCGANETHAVVNDHWKSRDENNEIVEMIDAGCWCTVCESQWHSIDGVTDFSPYDVKPHRNFLRD